MDGIIVVDKPKGYTSRDVVNIASKVYKTKKVGHTGTLDPLATGVLVLAVNRGTKLVDYLTFKDKEYVATVILGIETETLDKEGDIINECSVSIDESKIDEVLTSYIKTYLQEVPIYAAVRVNGKKLYEYARNNEEVSLPSKSVTIFDLKRISEVKCIDGRLIFDIRTKVSKGTYIRSLIRDIAHSLNTIGIMGDLRRTKQGNITLETANTIDQLKNGKAKLIPIEDVITDIDTVIATPDLEIKIINGLVIKDLYNFNKILFKNTDGKALAVYKKHPSKEGLIKPDIMLAIKKSLN